MMNIIIFIVVLNLNILSFFICLYVYIINKIVIIVFKMSCVWKKLFICLVRFLVIFWDGLINMFIRVLKKFIVSFF